MSVKPVQIERSALEAFLLDEISQLTQYPRQRIDSKWDLDRDFRLDWVMKGELIRSLFQYTSQSSPTPSRPDFHFDELHSIEDVIELVTGGTPHNGHSNGLIPKHQADELASNPEAFPLPIVEMSGTPHEMGFSHVTSQGLAILRVMRKLSDLIGPRLENLPELEDVLAKRDRYFSPEEMEELEGAAEAMGLPIRHMIALNVGLYPEYIPGCTQFAVTARRNGDAGLVHAVNEDSPVALMLREELTRMVHVRRPQGGIPCTTFSIVGQIGGLNGMNAAGIAVSSTILLDCPLRQETRYGCVHPILVRRILEQADSIEAALEIASRAQRAGAWSLCISHAACDRMCYLEYDGPRLAVHRDLDTVATSNHCLLLQPVAAAPEHSLHRMGRLSELLNLDEGLPISVARARKFCETATIPAAAGKPASPR